MTGARPPRFAALAALAFLAAGEGFAQQTDSALVAELKRYLRDGGAIATAPSRFDSRDWAEAAVISGGLVFVGTRDDRIDAWVQSHRSKQTDDFARIVTPFGSWAAVGVSVVALGGGLVSHNQRLLETGRDAVEAEILAAGITTPVLKYAVGRVRPSDGGDGDEFKPFSGNSSFPSGHATEAFAVASVLAARADGWVVPVRLLHARELRRVRPRERPGALGLGRDRGRPRRHPHRAHDRETPPARRDAAGGAGPCIRLSHRTRDFTGQRRLHGASFLLDPFLPLTPRVSGPTD